MRINDIIQEAQWSQPGHSSGRYTQHGKVNPGDKPVPARAAQGMEPIQDPEDDELDAPLDTALVGQPEHEKNTRSKDVSRWLDDHKKLFSRNEWYTLKMRMDNDATHDEIADSLGVTKMRVRQLESHALYKLRKNADFDAKFNPSYESIETEAVVDEEPASRALCTSGKPDSALGASQLSSCKSQGYRSRDGGKSHKVGSERIKVRGKKIKGKKYGGPLPDWS